MKRSLLIFVTLLFVFVLGSGIMLADFEGYMVAPYLFQRPTDIDDIDVTKVTHIHYAFGLIYNTEYLEINPRTGKAWGTPSNPDVRTPEPVPEGKLHTVYLPDKVVSDLARLDELRAENPDLLFSLSIGGGGARGFADVAATQNARTIFAQSVKELVDKYELDGIDLDWELPVNAGWGGIKGGPEDKRNHTLLVQAVRDAIGDDVLLSIASHPNLSYTSEWTEFEKVTEIVDYYNLMTYHLGTYYDSSLYSSTQWPVPENAADYHIDMVIDNYIANGCPPEKINIGFRPGLVMPGFVRGSEHYEEIMARLEKSGYDPAGLTLQENVALLEEEGFVVGWDESAQNSYIALPLEDDTEEFVFGYVGHETVAAMIEYVKERNLAGLFFWQWGVDKDNAFVTQMYEGLVTNP